MAKKHKTIEVEELDRDAVKSTFARVLIKQFGLRYLVSVITKFLKRNAPKPNLIRFTNEGIEYIERGDLVVARSEPEKIAYKDLKSVCFRYFGVETDSFGGTRDAIDSADHILIEFEIHDLKRKFYIAGGGMWGSSRKIVKLFYDQEIHLVKEYFNGSRVYLGESLTFSEIQKFKKKHNIG